MSWIDKKAILIAVVMFIVSLSYNALTFLFGEVFRDYLKVNLNDKAIMFVAMSFLAIIAIGGYALVEKVQSKGRITPQEWSKEKEEFYKKQIERLEQDKKTLQKRADHLETINKQLKELQTLFYILVRHGKVSVSDITRKWEEKYGKDFAFVVYEKGRGFNLKKNDSSKKKYLLEKLPKRYNLELSDEDRHVIWKLLQNVLLEKSPFSEFLNLEYGNFSAPLFKSNPPEPFHLIVFPKELRISPKDLARVLQEEYLRYANNLKETLKIKLNELIRNLPENSKRYALKLIIDDIDNWNPAEGVLVISPLSTTEIPLGKFSKDSLVLLERYHPNSLEIIKEGLTETILRNLTLSAFLEYAGIHPYKIQELEDHEKEIRTKLGIKQWGELFKVDQDKIKEVFSQYSITEEELEQILNAVEKITEIIERPDRIIKGRV